ncbi:MAG: hypothetical protein ABI852_02085 [Gemmatimonadaceae bacterium]
MNETARSERHRVGVMFVATGELNIEATSYLLLRLNREQSVFEFEIVQSPSDDALAKLLTNSPVERKDVEALLPTFHDRYAVYWEKELLTAIANEVPPKFLIIVSLARFADNLYSTSDGGTAVLALGNWQRYMAPPSLVEFIITLTLTNAAGLIDTRLSDWQHLGTRGCLWDYNRRLSEVRYKVLVGYVCPECMQRIKSGPLSDLARVLPEIITQKWLGKLSDPYSPAAISAKLGYNLFSTVGPAPTRKERLLQILQDEGAKELLKWISAIGLAATLIWLGLKTNK